MIFQLLCLSFLLCAGCGTVTNHTMLRTSEYGGVKYDYGYFDHVTGAIYDKNAYFSVYYPTWLLLLCVDLPISAVSDTLMFPADYFYWSGKPPLFEREPISPIR